MIGAFAEELNFNPAKLEDPQVQSYFQFAQFAFIVIVPLPSLGQPPRFPKMSLAATSSSKEEENWLASSSTGSLSLLSSFSPGLCSAFCPAMRSERNNFLGSTIADSGGSPGLWQSFAMLGRCQ